jgi:hypothetical protein
VAICKKGEGGEEKGEAGRKGGKGRQKGRREGFDTLFCTHCRNQGL